MPTFAGFRGTGSFATDERPKSFREFILWRDPNGRTPLTGLLSKIASEKVEDPEFSWWEEQLDIIRLQVNGALLSTDTTVVVNSGALQVLAGDIFQVETAQTTAYNQEMIQVVSVTNDTTFVVARGRAGSVAAAIGDDVWLTKIGNAFEEGSAAAGIAGYNPVKLTNFAQIFKTAFGITKTADEITNLRTGNAYKNDRKRKMFRHSEAMEQAFLWGKPYEKAPSGAEEHPTRYTGGLRHFITTNVKIYAAAPTEDDFIDFLSPLFDFHAEGAGDQRIVFAGNGALNTMNKLARDTTSSRINHTEVIKLYGMNLRRWILPQGEILVRSHPLLNVHPQYTYSMFIINPAGLIYRYLRDTKVEKNIQNPGDDVIKDQWLTECGLEIRHERTMGYIGNFNAAL